MLVIRIVAISLLSLPAVVSAQRDDPLAGMVFFGPGVGIDHGGIGMRLDVHTTRFVGVFGGVGYALAGIGWNAGLHLRMLPGKRACPYLTGMYGYNTAVKILAAPGVHSRQELYYGISTGAGVEFWNATRSRYFHLGLIIPFRSLDVERDYPEISKELFPVLVSLGLHFAG